MRVIQNLLYENGSRKCRGKLTRSGRGEGTKMMNRHIGNVNWVSSLRAAESNSDVRVTRISLTFESNFDEENIVKERQIIPENSATFSKKLQGFICAEWKTAGCMSKSNGVVRERHHAAKKKTKMDAPEVGMELWFAQSNSSAVSHKLWIFVKYEHLLMFMKKKVVYPGYSHRCCAYITSVDGNILTK
uniref:Uncharacterized protein n=1 Tax=Parascaris equorum TaxID=6256 RepID=A0A914RZ73_PAREQ